jgi:Electron transfer DM13
MNRERLIPVLIVATALGIGLLVLQRWVAETKTAAIVLVSIWFALVGIAALVATSRRPELRTPVLGTFAAILIATVAIGYWTGFRDTEVDEDVVMATAEASGSERDAGLAGDPSAEKQDAEREGPDKPTGPVSLAMGQFTGEDGHAGSGTATVVKESSGERTLTFTDFDVDPGAEVEVWLTQDETSFDDRVELGGLKGNVGDQEYEVPDDADLTRYDTVVLYCTPFTVRIAVAPLS